MRNKRLKLIEILLLGLGITGLHAQESIKATGGNASGSGGSASYSVGQIVYTTNAGTNGSVAQGVQQPYEISLVTAIEEAKGINLSVSAYPNPVTDKLILTIHNFKISTLNFQLFDVRGKLLQSEKIKDGQTQIDMSSYVPSTYFVRILSKNQPVKEFKIVKQ